MICRNQSFSIWALCLGPMLSHRVFSMQWRACTVQDDDLQRAIRGSHNAQPDFTISNYCNCQCTGVNTSYAISAKLTCTSRGVRAGLTLGLRLARWCRCGFLEGGAARRTWVGPLSLGVLQSAAVQRGGLRSAGEAADRARSDGSRARVGAGVRWWILGSAVVTGTLNFWSCVAHTAACAILSFL